MKIDFSLKGKNWLQLPGHCFYQLNYRRLSGCGYVTFIDFSKPLTQWKHGLCYKPYKTQDWIQDIGNATIPIYKTKKLPHLRLCTIRSTPCIVKMIFLIRKPKIGFKIYEHIRNVTIPIQLNGSHKTIKGNQTRRHISRNMMTTNGHDKF